ncbi:MULTISPECIES: GGDEF domain-containing protein [unclassified Pseudomonas]|uniref:GGDEF domain-containing protein n=1 Tax=unclassified Pseudomonas TaxID=196821 RepID=UPI0017876A2A|nr:MULTISPECIES: GGDEF domain-containing protein [unclassified Pseudomonas]MBD8624337.1 diguanylate cyclase [Pseudomonas sp. CFBP 13727]MBD8732895.1 diguanylate cyclase [Pseudomonas sp. CFBP 13710]
MSDDSQRWKEKYLQSIDQQEKLERRWNARLDLLRRGLVRSSLAAEGSDRAVDVCMKEMREVLRGDDMDARLAALIPRLEIAVLESEKRRQSRVQQIGTALGALVTQLQSLPLPRDVSKPLKKLAQGLEERAGQAREMPLLLSELSGLQEQALNTLDRPLRAQRAGLLQRLFGSPDPADASPVQSMPVPAAQDAPAMAGSTPDPVTAESDTAVSDAHAAPVAIADEPAPQSAPLAVALAVADLRLPASNTASEAPALGAADPVASPLVEQPTEKPAEQLQVLDSGLTDEQAFYALPASLEPPYSSVASHIETTLLELLSELTLPERYMAQAQAMHARIQRGLNWYELLPVLDELAVLMLAVNDGSQQEFERYLQQLNQRLENFQRQLQLTHGDHADSRNAALALDDVLREHVDGLQTSMRGAVDIDGLKQVLESRLEGLLASMEQHRLQREAREQEITARLQGLGERVTSMEREALDYRDKLEQQRNKALLDPLTGLPNRAAWSERLVLEHVRSQQTGNGLLLAILDLDHFKSINDTFGHQAGDKVLKIIANVLRKGLRGDDFIARFGGEEFALLMPGSDLGGGSRLLERLRAAVEQCPFHFKGERVSVTMSAGVAVFKPGENASQVLKRADQALYRAKEAGRNQIEPAP